MPKAPTPPGPRSPSQIFQSAADAEMEIVATRRIEQARSTTRQWKAAALAAQRESELLAEQFQVLAELSAQRDHPPLVIRPRRKSGSGEAAAFALASDWHVEEKVEPAQVSGLNHHNLQIADRKITNYYQNVVTLTELNRAGVEIRTMVHPLLGDFFSGHIHEDLVEVTELSPTQSIIWLEQRIAAGIRYLLDHGKFDRIVIPCTVGNHGRTTPKSRISTSIRHSYEWVLYQHLRQAFKQEKAVEFHIAEGYHVTLECMGLRVRLHHGDGLKYQGGVGGLTIPLNKAISAWNRASPADLDLLGHWHQLLWLSNAVVNGSLIGYGPYSVWVKADYEPPAQAFFLLDAQHKRMSVRAPIWLGDAPRGRMDGPRVRMQPSRLGARRR